ncbi:interleukin-1 receptor-associated kinase 1 isoform X4 [Phyllopteryx taeniolatus]|uniref:interleukin-1 receptor-associated kinase 1 isoform X4 n=1 Tax=Phyllopteryx taeniolatus TaxID=161469 RepID=UPI002AD5100C|nr:interleukin-1 receptor-associated kinase 1 isoform X4 [Phyllopteryx taeniolatus]
MSRGDVRRHFLYNLPAPVLWEFCRVMDGLSDLDWTRFGEPEPDMGSFLRLGKSKLVLAAFPPAHCRLTVPGADVVNPGHDRSASEVLGDQVNVRLAERKERRTDYVMSQWANRNGCVGELLDLLEHHQLLHPRDVILSWALSLKASPLAPPPVILSHFEKSVVAPHTMTTHTISTTVDERALPRPAPPPSSLQSGQPRTLQGPPVVSCGDAGYGVMCWSYEEVHAGTKGFSPALQVGEGGFGVVYRASLRNTDCAVKRLKQDCMLDLTVVTESFNTEVEKLSKLRHPNIVDLLGFCQGPSVCLIYSYMENRSLEDKLHNVSFALAWNLRVRIVHEASAALQFLHSPPDGHKSVIHGDVKSSNILLDRHLVAKLADFGLARFVSTNSSCHLSSKTTTVGRTSTVRGTLAYLPEEYVRNGQLGTAVDVYSFGVVLLEVLTGRRALEKDRKSGDIYLKDLVQEVQEGLTDSYAAAWSKQLDRRLITGGATELGGSMQMAALACRCLDRKWKKRPAMTEVYNKLQDINDLVRKSDLLAPHCVPPGSCDFSDSSVEVVTQCLSKLGPLEDTYQPPLGCLPLPPSFSNTSFHSSIPTPPLPPQYSSLPPHPSSLHAPSSTSLPPLTSSLHASSSSFDGPCETDESRGFSQYDLSGGSQFNCMLSSYTRDQYHNQPGPTNSQSKKLSEDQYNFHDRMGSGLSHRPPSSPQIGPRLGPVVPEIFSPPGPLQSLCPQTSDGVRSRKEIRGPEESDELEFLAATNT